MLKPLRDVSAGRTVTGFAVMLVLALLAAGFAAEAQLTGKLPRIGVLLTGSESGSSTYVAALRQGLLEHGTWRDGTSSSSTAMAMGTSSGCPDWRPNWWGSAWSY